MSQARTYDPEREQIEAAQRDPSRFAELYEAYFHRIYAFIVSRVRQRAEAEDLTSEVFHKALAGLAKFEWRGTPFSAWLYRIAANAIADRGHRPVFEQQHLPDLPDLPDPADLPPAELEAAERRARLFQSVDALAADQRRVILLRFAGQKSIREIARELKRSEGAVKQLQFRALENLRRMVEEAHV
jgi:RNA polymerase sigma-70 factor (ECF subfamily)